MSTATAFPIAHIPARIRRAARIFTRGTSRDRYARYTEEGAGLCRQHAAAAAQVRDREEAGAGAGAAPTPSRRRGAASSISARPRRRCTRRSARSEGQGIHLDALRMRGFPFADEVLDFIAAHEQVFVVEQNRDAQLRTLLVNEGGVDPAKLVPVLHYDGTPITARFITGAISQAAARRKTAARGGVHDLHRQAQAPSPRAADQQARLHPPRL